MLALGAYLVLQGELTPGAMIAASILLGRALAPVDQAISQWSLFERAIHARTSLIALLNASPSDPQHTALPRPRAKLEVQDITVTPPTAKRPTVRNLSFTVSPGQAVGVIGASGAGKSTLARALTGLWSPAFGSVRLDGATLDQYGTATLGQHIGYLPQQVRLFDGTVKENIARLGMQIDDAKVIEAAKMADAHDMILGLPNGYDTKIADGGSSLSGGQVQRIGLARALYGAPVLLVLDEPNASLDNAGSRALNAAIERFKSQNGAVLIMAQRPAAIQQCDTLLVLSEGTRKAFGPRDDVLKATVENHESVRRHAGLGLVS